MNTRISLLFVSLALLLLALGPLRAQPSGRTFSVDPVYPELVQRARSEFRAGRPVKAAKLLDQAIARSPAKPFAYYYKAVVKYATGAYQESSLLFTTAFLKSGRDARLYESVQRLTSEHASADHAKEFRTGFNAIKEHHYAKAEKIFVKLTTANKANASYFYQLGYARVELKKFPSALKAFKQGVLLNPLDYKLYSEIKFVQSELGDVDGLRGTIQEMRPIFGDRPQYRQELAFAMTRKQRMDEAIKLLKENVAKFPDFASSYFMLGQLHIMHLKDCANGRKYLDRFFKDAVESSRRYNLKTNVPLRRKQATLILRACPKSPAK